MMIKEVTTVGFDPIAEYEDMKRFERENDMRDWVKSESTVMGSTVMVMYIRTKSTWIGGQS